MSNQKQITFVRADGTEFVLPTKWQVCPRCNGNGSHVNSAIDDNGLTAADFDEDPDFGESYMRGDYDVTCEECDGRTTVQGVDLDRLPADVLREYEESLQEERDFQAAWRAEQRMERMMGC